MQTGHIWKWSGTRSLILLVLCGVMLLAVACTGSAQAEVSGDYEYRLINGGTEVEITLYNGTATDVVVPNIIEGRPVTSIGVIAFADDVSLASILFPDTLANIDDFAFYGCSGLKAFNVDIGNMNFSSSSGVLYNKEKTVLIVYPQGRGGAFAVPEGVTGIADWGFSDNHAMTLITFPESVRRIGDYAFSRCTALSSVVIPANVTFIGRIAFGGCTSLTSIDVVLENRNYTTFQGALFDKNMTTLWQYPSGLSGAAIVPSGVSTVQFGAFHMCANLTSVVMPDSIAYIGDYAFAACTSLVRMQFNGNAPECGLDWHVNGNASLVVRYASGAMGFTDPWYGLPTVQMVAPSPPQLVSALAGIGNVTLTWTPPVSNGSGAIDGYTVYFGENATSLAPYGTYGPMTRTLVLGATSLGSGNFDIVEIVDAMGSGFDFVDTVEDLEGGFDIVEIVDDRAQGLTPGKVYYFAIKATGDDGTSLFSNVLSALPYAAPSAPLDLSAAAGVSKVTLTWMVPSSNGGSPITGYAVYRVLTNGTQLIATVGASALTYVDGNLTAGNTYTYQVAAGNAAGWGDNSTMVNAVPTGATADNTLVLVLAALAILIVVAVIALLVMRRK